MIKKKQANFLYITIIFVLGAIIGLVVNIVVSSLATNSFSNNTISFIVILFVVFSIIGSIIVIIETAQEKRVNKSDNNKDTTETKSIGIRIRIEDGPVTIEAPDVESAMKVLQGIRENIMKHEELLKAESQGTMEETKPEASDVPDTKETEK